MNWSLDRRVLASLVIATLACRFGGALPALDIFGRDGPIRGAWSDPVYPSKPAGHCSKRCLIVSSSFRNLGDLAEGIGYSHVVFRLSRGLPTPDLTGDPRHRASVLAQYEGTRNAPKGGRPILGLECGVTARVG